MHVWHTLIPTASVCYQERRTRSAFGSRLVQVRVGAVQDAREPDQVSLARQTCDTLSVGEAGGLMPLTSYFFHTVAPSGSSFSSARASRHAG